MSKKLIITLLAAAVLLVGGFLVLRSYQNQLAATAYQHSSDKIMDDFNHDLLANDLKDAMALFTPTLQAGYSQGYWQKYLFDQFKGYKGGAVRNSKSSANQSGQPAAYPADAHAQKYVYNYTLNGLTYQITAVVINDNGSWRINELSGAYKQ